MAIVMVGASGRGEEREEEIASVEHEPDGLMGQDTEALVRVGGEEWVGGA